MRPVHLILTGLAAMTGLAFAGPAENSPAPASPPVPPPADADAKPAADPFKIVSRHPGDVTAEIADGKAVLSVRNHGIGAASISRGAGEWQQEIVLRVHLRGLESFKITRGPLVWHASVQSHGKHESIQTQPVEGKEAEPLKRGSSLFTGIRRLGADGAPVEGLPPAGGWFEFRIPRAFLTQDGGEMKLEWIDFYR